MDESFFSSIFVSSIKFESMFVAVSILVEGGSQSGREYLTKDYVCCFFMIFLFEIWIFFYF